MTFSLSPPQLPSHQSALDVIQDQGFVVLSAEQMTTLAGLNSDDLMVWRDLWNDLPPDQYLRDGGRYRRRRHSCFVANGDLLQDVPHRPHWQPVEYNALHGGMERLFEPMSYTIVQQQSWRHLLLWLGRICSSLWSEQPWYIEAHQFRIDTTDGIGRPTPEGAHRDGVDLVAVFLVNRYGIKGGETRVFDARGPHGQRFTLTQPWSVLLLDDVRVIHESTPIQPLHENGYRDTLVVTLRRHAFQGADPVLAP